MTDVFDNDEFPANVRRFPLPLGMGAERLPSEDDLEEITLALQVLVKEREKRPQLVAMLEEYPLLLGEYLTIPNTERSALNNFRRRYDDYFYSTRLSGDCISNLTERGYNGAAMIARKFRWAGQLKKMFAFYLEHHKETHPFNNNYLRNNPELRQRFGTLGPTLVKNTYQNRVEVKEIVAIIASSKPEIRNYYREPGYQSNAIPLPKRRR